MSISINDMIMEIALDVIIEEAAEEFQEAAEFDNGLTDIIDFLNSTEN